MWTWSTSSARRRAAPSLLCRRWTIDGPLVATANCCDRSADRSPDCGYASTTRTNREPVTYLPQQRIFRCVTLTGGCTPATWAQSTPTVTYTCEGDATTW